MSFETLSVKFNENQVLIIDQTLLPHVEEWVDISHPKMAIAAIKDLKVRGAPLIGIAAALSLGIYARTHSQTDQNELLKWAQALRDSRPTAVNLIHYMNEMISGLAEGIPAKDLYHMAVQFFKEDVAHCLNIAKYGAELLKNKKQILTHCNTGSLATAGVGTALGVIKQWAKSSTSPYHIYVDETRPLLQGGRLTAWELQKENLNYQIICDNMAGFLMQKKKVEAVIVGADRIAANGDTANKIGTYSLAVLCHYHQIPFYIAAPMTTVDPQIKTGFDIPIELRSEKEVKGFVSSTKEFLWAEEQAKAYNPAFDWVPSSLISGWVTDKGVFTKKDIQAGCFSKEN